MLPINLYRQYTCHKTANSHTLLLNQHALHVCRPTLQRMICIAETGQFFVLCSIILLYNFWINPYDIPLYRVTHSYLISSSTNYGRNQRKYIYIYIYIYIIYLVYTSHHRGRYWLKAAFLPIPWVNNAIYVQYTKTFLKCTQRYMSEYDNHPHCVL